MHYAYLRKTVALSDLIIIRIVGRRDLDASRAELHVCMFVPDHRYLFIEERKYNIFTDQVLISVIFRVYRHSSISKHGLRPCGSHLKEPALFSCHRISDMPEEAVLILMYYLCVRNRGLAYRTPVYHSVSLIYEPLIIQIRKYVLHGS